MRRPFCRTTSLLLDRVIIALEDARHPARRDALRREKARLERGVSSYGPPRRPCR